MPFRMKIDRVEAIQGRGTVVHGRVEEGEVMVGDTLRLDGEREVLAAAVVCNGKLLDHAAAGDQAGIALRSVVPESVQAGQVLTGLSKGA